MSRLVRSDLLSRPFRRLGHMGAMSLVEVLLAMAMLAVVSGAIIRFYRSQQRAYEGQYAIQERDRSLRLATNTLLRELAEAGYHAAGDDLVNHLSDWVETAYFPAALGVRLDANPKITLSPDNKPDLITFLWERPSTTNPTRLATQAAGTIIETHLSPSRLARQFRNGDLICFGGGIAYARVTDVSGGRLTIDTDPIQSGDQPLFRPVPAETPVGEISVVTYTVFNKDNDPNCRRHRAGHPELKRKVNAGAFQPVAEDICDLQLALETDGRIRIEMTARAVAPAGEARVRQTDRVRLANQSHMGIGSGCPLPAAPSAVTVLGGLDKAHPCRVLLAWDPVTTDARGDPLGTGDCALKGYRIFFDIAPAVFGRYVEVAPGYESGYELDVHSFASDVYHVSIAAFNSGGIGKKTPEIAIHDTVPPSPPAGLAAAWQPPGGVSLTWKAPPDCDLAGFQVFRKGTIGPYLRISGGLVPAGQLSFTDVAAPGGPMTYALKAQDGGNNLSSYSNAATVNVPGPVPPGPSP